MRTSRIDRNLGRLGMALCVLSALITIATTAVLLDVAVTSGEPAAIADGSDLPRLRPASRMSSAE